MKSKVAPMAPGEGNTKSPPKSPTRRCNAAKRWCWTLHNYSQEEMALLAPKLTSLGKFIWGEEVCPETGTPHLQGYMEFDKKCRPLEKVKVIRNGNNVISWKSCKGSRADNIKYCTKDWTNIQGNLKYDKPLKLITPGGEGYEWQNEIIDIVEKEEDNRYIHWFWEPNGNKGKSELAKYICKKYDALMCAGKASDMKYLIISHKQQHGAWPTVLLFDIPRSNEAYISYTGMEEIKNGCFASTKYESQMVIMNKPTVLCFANFYPETEKMSEDRWIIKEL